MDGKNRDCNQHRTLSFRNITFLILLFSLVACDDKGIEADFYKGRVRGQVRIRTVVPANTDEMRVVLAPDFPFEELQKLIISEPVKPQLDQSVESQDIDYEIEAPLGDYDAVAVLWKERRNPIQLTDIVGLYGDMASFELTPVSLTEENPVSEDVSMGIDFSRVDRRSTLEGKITFVGEWPANTQVVALAAYAKLSDLALGSIPPLLVFIPTGVREYVFSVGIAPGLYNYVFVGWLPIGKLNLAEDLRVLGAYVNEDAVVIPLDVPADSTISGINITADFALINNR